MKNLLILLKNNFVTSLNINKLKKTKKIKLLLFAFLFIYVFCSLIFSTSMSAYYVADNLQKYNLISFMITVFFFISSFVVFMFTVYNSKAGLFNSNDNDLLLSMPIKPSIILACRLILMMVYNLVTVLFVMAPAFVIYALKVDVSFSYYIFAIGTFLLLPVIPTVLASIVGYLIAFLTSKSNFKNWVEIFLSFIVLLVIMYISIAGDKILKFLINNISNVENIIKWLFNPIYLVNKTIVNNDYISFILFIITNILIMTIFVVLLSKSYKKIISKLKENKTKRNYIMKPLKSEGVNKALFFKEVKTYFSSPIYVFNTLFGPIIIIMFAVGSIFIDKGQLISLIGVTGGVSYFQVMVLLVSFVCSVSNTTSVSISIEGSKFWILKMLPISEKKIIYTKVLLNLMLLLPVTYISIVILKFTFDLSLLQMLALIIISTILSLFGSLFGIIANLLFPKMDAESDIVIVKRSLSVVIAILVPMFAIITLMSIYLELSKYINFNIYILVISLSLIVLTILEIILINTWGIKRIKAIN